MTNVRVFNDPKQLASVDLSSPVKPSFLFVFTLSILPLSLFAGEAQLLIHLQCQHLASVCLSSPVKPHFLFSFRLSVSLLSSSLHSSHMFSIPVISHSASVILPQRHAWKYVAIMYNNICTGTNPKSLLNLNLQSMNICTYLPLCRQIKCTGSHCEHATTCT